MNIALIAWFFGLRPSPSILGEVIAYHLNLYNQSEPEMYELLRKSLYVDDLLTAEENDEKGFVVYQKSKKINASGGFNLRKWNSNSQTLLKSIEACESSQEKRGRLNMLLQKMTSHTQNRQSHPEILK